MRRPLVYIYDANPLDLRQRDVQLRQQLELGKQGDWEIGSTSSRNSLLASLARDHDAMPRRRSVTLIDLRAETGDLDQEGFRICETIVRQPCLNAVTRPIIWVDMHTVANFRRAATAGAMAVVDDEWVDRGAGSPLAEVLSWANSQPTSPSAAVGSEPRVFPERPSNLDEEREQRDEAFRRWFGFQPMELHFALLWGIADAVELSFLKSYLAQTKRAGSERSAKRELERLEAGMTDWVREMERPGPARAEVARRFLAEVAPPHPSPIEELSWPKLAHVRKLLRERPDVVKWGFLPPGGQQVLERFFACLDPIDRSIAKREAAISTACKELAAASLDRRLATRDSIRMLAQTVDDAWADWHRFGEAEAVAVVPIGGNDPR